MKKLLLTLSAIAAIVAPVASVVACGSTEPDKAPGQTGPVIPMGSSDDSYLSKFKVTEQTEDAYIAGFAAVAKPNTVRTFKVFDNGMFKVKIDKGLIGTGKFFASEDKAKLEAQYIAQTINVGPAITHLEKGIQFVQSNSGNSLGGYSGVQIAVGNDRGSATDLGLYNESSLVDHEYGHHETMWDFMQMVGGSTDKIPTDPSALGGAVVKALEDAGYQSIADTAKKYVPTNNPDESFTLANPTDYPSDYNLQNPLQHNLFAKSNYPYDGSEIATRVLNILSCRTNVSAEDLYGGKAGGYIGSSLSMDVPAAFTSDLTFRRHSKDSVFGEGKDGTRIKSLVNSYMNNVFGVGHSKLHLLGNHNNGKVTAINFSGFGVGEMTHMEVQDASGKKIADVKLNTFHSRMGFKNELISNKWAYTYNNLVQNANDVPLDLDLNAGSYTLIGKDDKGNEVDLSKTVLGDMSVSNNKGSWTGFKGISSQGKHLIISK